MTEQQVDARTSRRIRVALFAALLILGYFVLRPFLVPIAWAGVLAYVTWPLYRKLRSMLGNRPGWSAICMTLLVTITLALPLVWMGFLLQRESVAAYAKLAVYLDEPPRALPEFILQLPWVGEWAGEWFTRLSAGPGVLKEYLGQWAEGGLAELGAAVGSLWRNILKFTLALVTLFFLYRDGEGLSNQIRRNVRHFLGERIDPYARAAGATTRAAVYSLVITALSQGVLAGIGYWIVGVRTPILLGALTALASVIPVFGTILIWGSVGLWLLLTGELWAGVGLLAWGILVVSWADNIVRPMVISSVIDIPFLIALFGVLGGLAAFGLIGLFIGPVILAVMMAVWREWLKQQTHAETGA